MDQFILSVFCYSRSIRAEILQQEQNTRHVIQVIPVLDMVGKFTVFVDRARGDNIYSTLIHFKHGGAGNWQRIVDRFMDFIKVKNIFTPLLLLSAKIFFSDIKLDSTLNLRKTRDY